MQLANGAVYVDIYLLNTMNRLFLFSTNNTSHGVWIFETYNSDKLNNAFFVFHFVQ